MSLGWFSGTTNCPCVFWETDSGKMPAKSYYGHTLVHVVDWMRASIKQRGCINYIHYNTISHKTDHSIQCLKNNGTNFIFWGSFLARPELHKKVWNNMEIFIQIDYPDEEACNYIEIRSVNQFVWDSVILTNFSYS